MGGVGGQDVIRIAILGADGRMGQACRDIIDGQPNLVLAGALVSPESKLLGQLVPEASGLTFSQDLPECDVVVDFSTPDALLNLLPKLVANSIAVVSGTTGLTDTQFDSLWSAAESVPVVWESNMSPGVGVLHGLVATAAAQLGRQVDVEILDVHHRHKVDAPSGTALTLARAIADAREQNPESAITTSRSGAREAGTIGIASMRAGSVVGEHTIVFALEGERIEVTHRAEDRLIFARGAILAAQKVFNQRPGRYRLVDLLAI